MELHGTPIFGIMEYGVGSLALSGQKSFKAQVGSSFNLSSPSTFTSCQLNPEATRKCGLGSLGIESQQRQQQTANFINFYVPVGRYIYYECHGLLSAYLPCGSMVNTPRHIHIATAVQIRSQTGDCQVAFPKLPGPQVTNSWTSHAGDGMAGQLTHAARIWWTWLGPIAWLVDIVLQCDIQ